MKEKDRGESSRDWSDVGDDTNNLFPLRFAVDGSKERCAVGVDLKIWDPELYCLWKGCFNRQGFCE